MSGLSDVDREKLAKMVADQFKILEENQPELRTRIKKIVKEMSLDVEEKIRRHQESARKYRIR